MQWEQMSFLESLIYWATRSIRTALDIRGVEDVGSGLSQGNGHSAA